MNRTRVELVAADELLESLMPNLLVVALACDAERVTVRVTGAVGHGVDEDSVAAALVLVFVLVALVFLPVPMSFTVAAAVVVEAEAKVVAEVTAAV